MTELSAHQLRVGGIVLATLASAVEVFDGLETTAADRGGDIVEAWRPGLRVDTWALVPEAKVQRLRIWAAPWDADGAVNPAYGREGHRRANTQAILQALRTRAAGIPVEWDVPDLAGGVETMRNTGRVRSAIAVTGDQLRRIDVTIEYPYPYWHLGDPVGRPSASSHVFTPGGGAEIWDMVYVFEGDGVLEHVESGDTITVAGSSSAVTVDVGARTITQAGVPARNLARFNRPWWSRWLNPGAQVTLNVTGTTVAVAYHRASL